jgi:DNA ligase 1
MLKTFKPMLATPIDFSKLDPKAFYLVSPKLDGIRCLINQGQVYTRSMKLVPNKYISSGLSNWFTNCGLSDKAWLDGELVIGDPKDPMCYRRTVSAVMSENVITDDCRFYIFDIVNEELMDADNDIRSEALELLFFYNNKARIILLEQEPCLGCEVEDVCNRFLEVGYEGAMIKPLKAPYKCGRATSKSMELMKFKSSEDAEAIVVGVVQKKKNLNEITTNELGLSQRSSHKSGKVLVDELGALEVEYKGQRFSIGSGFTEEERKQFWLHRDKLYGKMVKFKYTEYGGYDVPRFPVFIGFRSKLDL